MTRRVTAVTSPITEKLLEQYGCGPVKFTGTEDGLYERHLLFDNVVSVSAAGARERFEAVAHAVRDVLSQRWIRTEETYAQQNAKRIYFLSLEFLIGRSLGNNIINLLLDPIVRDLAARRDLDWVALLEQEPDAALGHGGLGRVAASFLDSMTTLQLPAMGYGLRYEYGSFKQSLRNGWQHEEPDNWLRRADPWEVARPNERVEVPLGCAFELRGGSLRVVTDRPSGLVGIPYDRPVVGYGGRTVNTLRLWSAATPDDFDFQAFSHGEFVGALAERLAAESLTRVLYPDDSTAEGQGLRFVQEYFLVACSLADLVRRFRRTNADWSALPAKVAIQLNDTHPAMAVPELMRILLDDAGLGWDEAWDLTCRATAYTSHAVLPDGLPKWPLSWFELLLPRHLEIVFEINRRLLDEVRARFPGDDARLRRVSLIDESGERMVRMAHLAIAGAHSINGVGAVHSARPRTVIVKDLAEQFPERFNSKGSGVSVRRWLLLANPALAVAISTAIGDGWITDPAQLRRLAPLAEEGTVQQAVRAAKREAKLRLAAWLRSTLGQTVNPDTLFDCHLEHIHQHTRQLLNALRVIVLYQRLRNDPGVAMIPRTFLFAGKARPGDRLGKAIIKLINTLAVTIERDRRVHDLLKVVFIPDWCVSLAERVIPAADVAHHIATAGYEASVTSAATCMMNGALTVATRDNATSEIAREAGEDNLFLFGLTSDQVRESRAWYSPYWHYDNEPETRAALDLILSDDFSPGDEPGVFAPLRDALLTGGDACMHLADLSAYLDADLRVVDLYAHPEAWTRRAIANIAASGTFSSDRVVAEYAAEIWDAKPCPVP